MGRSFLVYLLASAALMSLVTGMLSPSIGDNSANEVRGTYFSATDVPDERIGEASGQRVEIERSGDGHFYADVAVNGKQIRFLVDTGASGIALSRDDARRVGLATSISMPQVVGQGAGGVVHGELVTLERVVLGPAEATDVAAVILDSGSQSLLGQSFLSNFSSVEIRDDRMVLR